MKLKQKRNTLLAIIFLSFAGILSLSIVLTEVLYFQERAEKVALHNALNKTKERESVVTAFLNDIEASLTTLSENSHFTEFIEDSSTKEELQQLLETYIKLNPHILKLQYIGLDGYEKIAIQRSLDNNEIRLVNQELLGNLSDNQAFLDALNHPSKSVWFSAISLASLESSSDNQKTPILVAAIPIYHQDKEHSLLVATYSMDNFIEQLTNTPLYDMILYDDNGYTLFHYSNEIDKSWGNTLDHQYNIAEEFPNDYASIASSVDLETDSFVSRHFDTSISGGLNLILQLKASYLMAEKERARNEYIAQITFILVFSVILTYLIIRIFSKTLLNLDKIKALNNSLNQATHIAKIGFWEIDAKSYNISWNEGISILFELDQDISEMTYERFLSFIVEDDREYFREKVLESITKQVDFFINLQIITSKKTRKYVECRGKHYYDRQGKHIKSIGSIYDTSDAHYSELKFRSILNLASDGIYILDSEGKLVEYSYSFANNLGYSLKEMKQLTVFDWNDSIPKKDLINRIKFLMTSPSTFETKHKRKDGTNIDVQINAKGIILDGKSYLYASQRDITDMKEKERLLIAKTSEQEALLSLFDIGDSILFRWENTNPRTLVYVSNNVFDVLGYTKEEFLSQAIGYRDCIYSDDLQRVIDEVNLAIEDKASFIDHESYRLITKSGEIKWVYDQTVIQRDAHGEITHLIGYILDITSEKCYEQSLEDKQKELQAVNIELESSMDNLKQTMLLYEGEKAKYKTILELASDGIFLMDLKGNLVEYSKKSQDLLGYDNDEMDQLTVYDWDKGVNPDIWHDLVSQMLNEPIDIERVHTRQDGSTYIAHITARSITIDHTDYIYASVRDVSEAKRIQEDLKDSKLRWQFAVEGNKDGLWDWNIDKDEVFLSPQWKTLMGYTEAEFPSNVDAWKAIVIEEDIPEITKSMDLYLSGQTDSYANEHRIKHKDGHKMWVRDRGIIVERNEDGSPHRVIGTTTDISEYVAAMEFIREQTYIDELTQLQNRKAYNKRLEELLEQYHRYGITFSMIMLDIDYFKLINDQFGHSTGDEVLIELSHVLNENVRKNDYIYRIGGEEFIILATNTKIENAVLTAEKLRTAVQANIDLLSRYNKEITISLGVIEVNDGDTSDSIFARVDKAMYQAKENGRNQVVKQ